MERRECETRYELAAAILPSRLRRIAMELPEGERSLEAIVTTEELETLCDIAAEFSRYASIETLRQGFLPVRGGFRVGLCGSAVVKDGEVTNLKQISSAVIRISREQKGIAQAVAPRLFRDGRFVSTLLLSPPGGGKTTLLRDLVRQRWRLGDLRKPSGVRQSPAFRCRKRTSGPCLNWSMPCKAMKRVHIKVYCL